MKINLLADFKKDLLCGANILHEAQNFSDTAKINNRVFNTEKYDAKFDHIDCYTVEYKKLRQGVITKAYGSIITF